MRMASIVLYGMFWLNELLAIGYVLLQRKSLAGPNIALAAVIMLFGPWLYWFDYPAWAVTIIVVLQAAGLLIEVSAEIMLLRHNSFGIAVGDGTTVVTGGPYRWFSHPIYVGMLLQLAGWSLWMPLTTLAVWLAYRGLRAAVAAEMRFVREQLAAGTPLPARLDGLLWRV